ncbi:sortase [Actinoplanes sp. SE50]|uniref:class F sortase n=1 Tax=unclassified Actinoplanes TaxID=2626549 RepID=UPI00023ED393|nr:MULTISPECIES: class F sortase [unclassified Actinoplanes]AEV82215.1 peptidase C60 sortase A and B [Actinoplanes sp. SE50/110]ATO80614.1 sortase [Actinoplanes sp. SE50]SLL98020.1 class F sortase [Actinoplanes sp. SE50/110]
MTDPTGKPPHVPESVRRKRPAQVITAPPPGTVTGPLPAPRPQGGRPAFRVPLPRRTPTPRPAPGRRRRWPIGWIALILFFLGLFAVGMGLGVATGFDLGMFRGPDAPPPRSFPVLEPSRPERLSIPELKVDAPILQVGLAGDGSVDVPPLNRHNEVGWFDGGPTPGQFGPALFVGHADTRTGPSVFHDLGRLKPKQRIEVRRADGTVAVFEVNAVEHYDKDQLPVGKVYGDYSRPSLRLMTCGGRWLGGEQGYSDNVVVYASLIDSRK